MLCADRFYQLALAIAKELLLHCKMKNRGADYRREWWPPAQEYC